MTDHKPITEEELARMEHDTIGGFHFMDGNNDAIRLIAEVRRLHLMLDAAALPNSQVVQIMDREASVKTIVLVDPQVWEQHRGKSAPTEPVYVRKDDVRT